MGFWSNAWRTVTYPWRSDGLPEDFANSSLFPFKEQQDLARIPDKDLTEEQRARYNKLNSQTNRLMDGGITGNLSVSAERFVDGAETVVGNAAKSALEPVIKPFKKALDFIQPALDWLKENWKMVAAGAAALFFSGGSLGMVAMIGAGLFIGNEILEKQTGKGLIGTIQGMFSGKQAEASPTLPPAVEQEKSATVAPVQSQAVEQAKSPEVSAPGINGRSSSTSWVSRTQSSSSSRQNSQASGQSSVVTNPATTPNGWQQYDASRKAAAAASAGHDGP